MEFNCQNLIWFICIFQIARVWSISGLKSTNLRSKPIKCPQPFLILLVFYFEAYGFYSLNNILNLALIFSVHSLKFFFINTRATKNIPGLLKVIVTSPAGLMKCFLNVDNLDTSKDQGRSGIERQTEVRDLLVCWRLEYGDCKYLTLTTRLTLFALSKSCVLHVTRVTIFLWSD